MRIKRMPKRLAPAHPEVVALLDQIAAAPDDELPDILDRVSAWSWPRGDLHYWTKTLNRFDAILEQTCKDYDLPRLQVNDFTPRTKRLLLSVIRFSRLLLENCTNRKLYASYEHLNELLLTNDLDILEATLRLILRPAQQYGSTGSIHHEFGISEERLLCLARGWNTREHGVEIVDLAKPETQISDELKTVQFQFFRRTDPSRVLDRQGELGANGFREDRVEADRDIFATPSRPSRPGVPQRAATLGGPPTSVTTPGPSGAGVAGAPGGKEGASGTDEGLTIIDLGDVTKSGDRAIDVLLAQAQDNEVPKEDHFALYQKIRVAQNIQNPAARQQMLVMRLLAIAIFAHIASEATANTRLFLYEPDLVQSLVELIRPERDVPQEVQSAALYALDAIGRYRGKLSETLGAVNASLNHGILLNVIRRALSDLAVDPPRASDGFIDSLLGFIAFISSSPAGSNMVVSAGIIPLLVQFIQIPEPKSFLVCRTISRAVGLLDSIIYAFQPAFGLFCNAQGLETLVRRIKEEVEYDIRLSGEELDSAPLAASSAPPHQDNVYGKLPFGRASLLRSMLKSLSHMMTSTGTADGLRNLIDSTLLQSIRMIMENRTVFGPQILALAINIMATFVHNEPTSLGVLEEAKLPEAFYAVVEQDIGASWDVIISIPNAVGALCLNQAGLDLFNSKEVIPKLFGIFTSQRHTKVLQDRDNASMLGSAIDELIRHHPSLKQRVFDSIIHTLETIEREGQEFVPDEGQQSFYALQAVSEQDRRLGTTAEDVDMGDTGAGLSASSTTVTATQSGLVPSSPTPRSVALADVVMDESDIFRKDGGQKDNRVVAYMDVIARFLESFMQTVSHCKDFLKADGMERLSRLYASPCLPYDFASSMAADSMITLIRSMSEIQPQTVMQALVNAVKTALEESGQVWAAEGAGSSAESRMLPMLDVSPGEQLAEANKSFRVLVSLNARTHLLSDVCKTLGYSSGKVATAFLGVLNGTDEQQVLARLGALQRTCTWENILLKSVLPQLPLSGKEEEKPASPEAAIDSQTDSAQYSSHPREVEQPHQTAAGFPNDMLFDVQVGSVESNIKLAPTAPNAPQERRMHNGRALRYLAAQIPISLSSFFQDVIKMLLYRRNPDVVQARRIAEVVAGVVVEHLRWRGSSNEANNFAYATVMVGHTTTLIFGEGPGQGLQTVLLIPFQRAGGPELLFEILRRYIAEVDSNFDGTVQKPDQDAGIRLGHVCGGLKVVLNLLQSLSAAKPLLEAAQTTVLTSRDRNRDSPDYFDPHELLIKLRAAILPAVREIWDKPWLASLPLSINRSVVQIILNILKREGEESPPKPDSGLGSGTGSGVASPFSAGGLAGLTMRRSMQVLTVPDENKVRQLMDMGFSREAAENALVRCHNNLSAATEYLLMHPELTASASRDRTSSSSTPQPPENADERQSQGERAGGDETSTSADTSGARAEGDTSINDADADDVAMDDNDCERSNDEGEKEQANPGDKGKEPEKPSPPPREQLESVRLDLEKGFVRRALELADHHEPLVFDVQDAFTSSSIKSDGQNAFDVLLKDIDDAQGAAFDEKEATIAVRFRLLALILNDTSLSSPKMDDRKACRAMDCVVALAKEFMRREPSSSPLPRWLASEFLVADALLGIDEEPRDVKLLGKDEIPSDVSVRRAPLFQEARSFIFQQCMVVLRRVESTTLLRGDFLALMRTLVLLTRRHDMAAEFVNQNGLQLIFKSLLNSPKEVAGCQPLVITILRHITEDTTTLRTAMQNEMRAYFALGRNKLTDVSNFIRSYNMAANRDPDVFVEAAKASVELAEFNTEKGSGYIKLKEEPSDKSPEATKESGGHSASPTKAGGHMQVDEPSKVALLPPALVPNEALDSAIHFLLSELLKHSKAAATGTGSVASKKDSTGVKAGGTQDVAPVESVNGGAASTSPQSGEGAQEEQDAPYLCTCFIMQCLTELLSSYTTSKLSFINFSKKRSGSRDPATPIKPKAAVLSFFLTELVPLGFLHTEFSHELRKRMTLSNWAMSVLVALTADVATHQDVKDVSPELVSVRKFVLDGIAKAIKDASASAEPIELRYGRLYALADLTHRLLTARPNGSAKHGEDSTLHIAKTMLEKNYVTVLTNALADVDLNLPSVKALLDEILRPLELLTKVAIKMGKADRSSKGHGADKGEEHSESEVSDEDMMSEDESVDYTDREETPDFYRTSSLGMHTGEMEGMDYEDEYDDMDEEDDDEEMYDGEDGTLGDSDASDEDDDLDDMHHVDEHVDVVIDDDDEDADEDDNEDSDDDENDEGGSGGEWVDEDDEDEGGDEDEEEEYDEDDEDGEALDYVLGAADGDLGGEAGPIVEEVDVDEDQIVLDGPLFDGDEDDDGEQSIMDEEEDFFENEEVDFSGEPPAGLSDDRFGANWGWTTLPFARDAEGARGSRPSGMPGHMMSMVGGGRRNRLLDYGEMTMTGGRRRGDDDMTSHPLLVDRTEGATPPAPYGARRAHRDGRQATFSDWAQSINDLIGGGGGEVLNFLETLLSRGGAAHGTDIHIEFPHGHGHGHGPMRMPAVATIGELGGGRGLERRPRATAVITARGGQQGVPASRPYDPVMQVQSFTPITTVQRWQEESRIVNPSSSSWMSFRNHVLNALLPAYWVHQAEEQKRKEEEEKQRREKEREEEAKREEERKAEEARKAEEEARKAEEEARRAEEERVAREAAEAAAHASNDDAEMEDVSDSAPGSSAEAMELRDLQQALTPGGTPAGAVSAAHGTPTAGARSPSGNGEGGGVSEQAGQPERVTVTVHGNSIDITDTGIDPSFLEALPDDMREEVLNQHFRERRAEPAAAPQDTNISPEFLEALPPEIRAEVLQQEALEQVRRRSLEQRRQRGEGVAGEGGQEAAGQPAEIDSASFLAGLDPSLRQTVLLDQDETFLQTLPPAMLAEVNWWPPRQSRRLFGQSGRQRDEQGAAAAGSSKKASPSRDAIQLLDKAGVATLVRLLFFPEMNKRGALHKVLANLSENSKTRTELFNLLLTVLQDGTSDPQAMDRSFSQAPLRAGKGIIPRPTPKRQKTNPEPAMTTPGLFGSGGPLAHMPGENVPNLLAQRSFDALAHLVAANPQVPLLFLTESDVPVGLKRSQTKKGKGKEKEKPSPATKYPIVVLLGLLDRPSLLKTPALMESFTSLLSTITRPLTSLKKEEASEQEGQSGPGQPTEPPTAGDSAAQATEALQGSPGVGSGRPAQGEAGPSLTAGADASAPNQLKLTRPPQIPAHVLRLVVNILTAGECTSKTFQQTLALILHLSHVHDSREVIATELRTRIEEFGTALVGDLDALVKGLEESERTHQPEPRSLALGRFSPADAVQSRMLRCLKVLDYMYEPHP